MMSSRGMAVDAAKIRFRFFLKLGRSLEALRRS